jgi:rhodanese-related sulfurtransferase
MTTPIDRHELQRLLADEHAQLVEVLPEAEFADEHLLGAINIPLKQLDRNSTTRLDRDHPVTVYYHDTQRHEPTSRVAAREHRIRAGLRLRRRQG